MNQRVRLDHHVTSRAFHSVFVATYPGLRDHLPMMRMALYLLSSTWMDEDGSKVIPARTIAELHDHESRLKSFRTGEAIEAFGRQVASCEVTPHQFSKRTARARSVRVNWPREVLEAWEQECLLSPTERATDAVYFVTGRRRKARREHERLRMQRLEAARTWSELAHPGAELAQFLLRQQPTTLLGRINRNYRLAAQAATSLVEKAGDGAAPQRVKTYTLCLLQGLGSAPVPMYQKADRSVRLFGEGPNLLYLPASVRQALMTGCWEFDMASAQLAIVARAWNVPNVQTFLETGESIWPVLAEHCGVEVTWAKPTLKEALYTLIFGGSQKRIKDGLMAGLAAPDQPDGTAVPLALGQAAGKRFLTHPLIMELLYARRQRLKTLSEQGTAQDVFGTTYKLSENLKARSILAQQVQALELEVMRTILPYLQAHPELKVLAWQHDGFTLHCTVPSKWRTHVKAIQALMDKEMQSRGYASHLLATPLGHAA